MEKELFQSIINDNKTIKFGDWHGQYFLFEQQDIVVGFFFMHRGYPKDFLIRAGQRISLSVMPKSILNIDIPLKNIEETTQIVVNSDYPKYAMTFLLTIDKLNRRVEVKIKDIPILGKSLITVDEKNGIVINY